MQALQFSYNSHSHNLIVQDDVTALDVPTMRRWNLILRVFVSEYLGLRPKIASKSDSSDAVEEMRRVADELVRDS